MSAPATEQPPADRDTAGEPDAPAAPTETARRRFGHRFSESTIAAAGWAAVYAAVALTGHSFSTAYLTYGWQLVPWDILSRHPLSSVWYLHIQPPLWNLILGGAARLSPLSDARTLQAVQFAFGLALVWLLADILRRLGLSRWVVVGLALVATLNPEVLKNAFEPTYELPVAAGLAACLWALVRLAERPTGRRVALVATLATAVSMTRTLYHPLWTLVMVAIAGVIAFRTVPLRVILAAAAIPVVVMGSWMLKNEMLFHEFTLSTWTGMNLQRSTVPIVPAAELDRLLAEGKVSPIAKIGPFGNYDLYRSAVAPCTPSHDNPAVTTPGRLDAGGNFVPNFNYECFIPVYRQAGADARAVIRDNPRSWLRGRAWSGRTTFAVSNTAAESPSKVFQTLDVGYRIIRVDVTGTVSTAGWGTPIYGTLAVEARFSLTTVALTLLLIVAGAFAAWRVLRRRGRHRVWDVAVAVAGFLVLYTYVVGMVGELGEQARFRTMTDPILFAFGFAVVLRLLSSRFDLPWVWTGGQPPVEPLPVDQEQAVADGR